MAVSPGEWGVAVESGGVAAGGAMWAVHLPPRHVTATRVAK
ncbi:hypothetical protein HMPREF1868_00843 [Olsenella sp. DNF00959]|nr:hypothetical protein HMPREF1868_00843 [Olsenella sp. DNF00959]